MAMSEEMVAQMVLQLRGSYRMEYHANGADAPPVQIDFTPPWRRISMARPTLLPGRRCGMARARHGRRRWGCPLVWNTLRPSYWHASLHRVLVTVALGHMCKPSHTPACRRRKALWGCAQISGLEEALGSKLPSDLETEDARASLDRLVRTARAQVCCCYTVAQQGSAWFAKCKPAPLV